MSPRLSPAWMFGGVVALVAALLALVMLRAPAPPAVLVSPPAEGGESAVDVRAAGPAVASPGARTGGGTASGAANAEDAPIDDHAVAPADALPDAPPLPQDDDGPALTLDAEGRFLPSAAAMRLFEQHLATMTDVADPDPLATRNIELEIRQLPASAQAGARDFLHQYLRYRTMGAAVRERLQAGNLSPAEQAAAWSSLQGSVFGPERAAQLFGNEQR